MRGQLVSDSGFPTNLASQTQSLPRALPANARLSVTPLSCGFLQTGPVVSQTSTQGLLGSSLTMCPVLGTNMASGRR